MYTLFERSPTSSDSARGERRGAGRGAVVGGMVRFKFRRGTRFFVLHIMVPSWCAQNDAQNRCA